MAVLSSLLGRGIFPGGATKYSSTVLFESWSSFSAQSPSITASSLRYKTLSSRTESIGSTPVVSTTWSWSANRMASSKQASPCLVRKSTKASRSSLSTRSAGIWAGGGSWSSGTGSHVATFGIFWLSGWELSRRVVFALWLCGQLILLLCRFVIEYPSLGSRLNNIRGIFSDTPRNVREAARLNTDIFNIASCQSAMSKM